MLPSTQQGYPLHPTQSLTPHACVLSSFSHVQFFVTLWTVACQTPLSTRFSRQEYWSGLPCPPQGDLPGPGIKSNLHLLHWQLGSLPLVPPGRPPDPPCQAAFPLGCPPHSHKLWPLWWGHPHTIWTLFLSHWAMTPLCGPACILSPSPYSSHWCCWDPLV